jgi:hypothetical protein
VASELSKGAQDCARAELLRAKVPNLKKVECLNTLTRWSYSLDRSSYGHSRE